MNVRAQCTNAFEQHVAAQISRSARVAHRYGVRFDMNLDLEFSFELFCEIRERLRSFVEVPLSRHVRRRKRASWSRAPKQHRDLRLHPRGRSRECLLLEHVVRKRV